MERKPERTGGLAGQEFLESQTRNPVSKQDYKAPVLRRLGARTADGGKGPRMDEGMTTFGTTKGPS